MDDSGGRVSRRALLRVLLGSPLFFASQRASALEELFAALGGNERALIAEARDAIDVFDFERLAKERLLPPHWAFLSQGIHDESTLRANREAFGRFALRPRRLVDVRDLDTTTEIVGTKLASPIVLAPCGAQKAFHAEGELAVARAAKAQDHLQILSTGTSTPLEEVNEARGEPVWFQLYTPGVWAATRRQLRAAEEAGCKVVVLTVDNMGTRLGENRDRTRSFRRAQNPECQGCHGGFSRFERGAGVVERAARAVGIDLVDAASDLMILDWAYVDRIRDGTSMKLVIKGILHPDDARLCVEHGADAVVVSNHGGRSIDLGLSSIEVLPEIARAVDGSIPILIDSGFRRGEDFAKALALGASAVCIGRPYLWGLASFGQEGVEAVLELLRGELAVVMQQLGTPMLSSITADHVVGARGAGD